MGPLVSEFPISVKKNFLKQKILENHAVKVIRGLKVQNPVMIVFAFH